MSMQGGFYGKLTGDEDHQYKLSDIEPRIVRMFIRYLRPHIPLFVTTVLLTFIIALIQMGVPYLSKIAIDDVILPGRREWIHWIFIAYIGLYALLWFVSYLSSLWSMKLGQRIVADIRNDLFSHVTSLAPAFFTKSKTGEVMARLTGDVNALSDFVSSGMVNLTNDIFTICGIVIIMFSLHAPLSGIVFITIPIIFFGTRLIGRQIRSAYGSVRETAGSMSAGLEENLSGIKTVKSMAKEKDNVDSFDRLNKQNLAAQIKAVLVSAIFFPFMSVTTTLGTALVVLAGGIMYANAHPSVTIGLIIAFIGYTNRFFLPLRDLSQIANVYQGAAASAERIFELFETKYILPEPKTPATIQKPVVGHIRFENVNFSYDKTPVLNDLNFEIKPKTTVAIVGASGVGKTTVARCMARLYDVASGSVTIDGTDVRHFARKDLVESVMLIGQDVFLFEGTILDNIRYADPSADEQAVRKAAEQVCAHPFIESLPDGYKTMVGQRGTRLSGGQRQLIAFARAVMADRPILILDEATSAVDTTTETLLQKAMERLFVDKTAVVIAHRFTTIKNADMILVMDQGRIVGSGSHHVLYEECDVYRAFADRQTIDHDK